MLVRDDTNEWPMWMDVRDKTIVLCCRLTTANCLNFKLLLTYATAIEMYIRAKLWIVPRIFQCACFLTLALFALMKQIVTRRNSVLQVSPGLSGWQF